MVVCVFYLVVAIVLSMSMMGLTGKGFFIDFLVSVLAFFLGFICAKLLVLSNIITTINRDRE